MIFLGIDPGFSKTGYGIIKSENNHLIHITNGVINLPKDGSFPIKIKIIYLEIQKIIKEFSPQEVAIETPFLAKNARTAIKLGQAQATAILAAVNAGLKVYEYSPLEIKKSLVGYGRAEKTQVKQMVINLLGRCLPDSLNLDASDALATAICHINHHKFLNLIDQYDRPFKRQTHL